MRSNYQCIERKSKKEKSVYIVLGHPVYIDKDRVILSDDIEAFLSLKKKNLLEIDDHKMLK